MAEKHRAPRMTAWDGFGLDFIRFDLAPGARVEIEKAFHDGVTLLAFEGCVWSSVVAGVRRREAPGEIVTRPAGQAFSLKLEQLDAAGGVCREIHIPDEKFGALYELPDNPLPKFEFSRAPLAHPRLAAALFEAHRLTERNDCALETEVRLASTLEMIAAAQSGKAPRKSRACARRNAEIVSFLRENFSRAIRLQELADLAGMNPFVLLRQFRNERGMTPHEYLQIFRVNEAKRQIFGGTALAEVAQNCGFADQSHLTRQFKRRAGVTPGQFAAATPN